MVKITKITNGDISSAIKKTVKETNLSLGVQIASQAKALAPVDYGQLRNSISASSLTETKLLNNNSGKKADALDTSGLTGDEVYVGSNSDHTIYQEYGTVKQVAQPFLRPAMELKAKGSNVGEIATKYSRANMEAELKKRKETVKTYG